MVRSVLLGMALMLWIVPAASAKSLAKAEACGLEGCVSLLDASQIDGMRRSSESTVEPPAVGPYYVVRYEYSGPSGIENAYSFLYEPRSGLFATNGPEPGQLLWFAIGDRTRAAVHGEVAHFRPFPIRRVSWPSEIKSPGRLPMPDAAPQPSPASGTSPASARQDWSPYVFLALVLALAGCVAARRVRLRRPRPA